MILVIQHVGFFKVPNHAMNINGLVVWKQGGDTWHRDNLELSSVILLSLVGQAQW